MLAEIERFVHWVRRRSPQARTWRDYQYDLRLFARFMLMPRCGLRISEVACLQLGDLYLDERYPRLVAHGKGARQRSVYLSPQAEYALRAYLAERPSGASDFVFLSYQNKGLSTTAIARRLMRCRDRDGVTLTAHRQRHSFAPDLGNADAAGTSIHKL